MNKEFPERLIVASEDERFDLLAQAYARAGRGAEADELTLISRGDNALAKVLLCRFLAHAPEAPATALLRDIMLTGDTLAVTAAIKAYTRNTYANKGREIIPVLAAPSSDARLFAIETLANEGVTQALHPILAVLSQSTAQEEQLRILSALRRIPDPLLLEALKTWLGHTDAEVRARAVLAIGSLYVSGQRRAEKVLLGMAADESPRVRSVVLWQLRQRKLRQHVPLFLARLQNDANPETRSEALAGLIPWPVKTVVRTILKAITRDPVRVVALKAQGTLFSMRGLHLESTLKRLCRDSEADIRGKALETLAGFRQNSPRFQQYLARRLARTDDPRERLPIFNAFAALRRSSAIGLLEKYLSGDAMTSYASMSAILKSLGSRRVVLAVRYLEKPDLPDLLRQMVLKHLAKVGMIPGERLALILTGFLQSANMNVRYLSAQILAHAPRAETLLPLARLYTHETDPAVLHVLGELIGDIIRARPSLFSLPVVQLAEDDGLIRLVLDKLALANVGATDATSVAGTILTLLRGDKFDRCAQSIGAVFADFLRRGVLSHAQFAGAVKLAEHPSAVIGAVSQALATGSAGGCVEFSGEFVTAFKSLALDAPEAWLKLIPLLGRSKAVAELAGIIADDTRSALHAKARDLLRRYWGEGAT